VALAGCANLRDAALLQAIRDDLLPQLSWVDFTGCARLGDRFYEEFVAAPPFTVASGEPREAPEASADPSFAAAAHPSTIGVQERRLSMVIGDTRRVRSLRLESPIVAYLRVQRLNNLFHLALACPGLTSLDLEDVPRGLDLQEALAASMNLRRLRLCRIQSDCVELFAGLQHTHMCLQSLEVTETMLPALELALLPDLADLAVSACKQLRVLIVDNCPKLVHLELKNVVLHTFRVVAPDLACIKLTGCTADEFSLQSNELRLLRNVSACWKPGSILVLNCPQLSLLQLAKCPDMSDECIDRCLAACPLVDELSLQGCDSMTSLHIPNGCRRLSLVSCRALSAVNHQCRAPKVLAQLKLMWLPKLLPSSQLNVLEYYRESLTDVELAGISMQSLDLVLPNIRRLVVKQSMNLLALSVAGPLKRLVISGVPTLQSLTLSGSNFAELDLHGSSLPSVVTAKLQCIALCGLALPVCRHLSSIRDLTIVCEASAEGPNIRALVAGLSQLLTLTLVSPPAPVASVAVAWPEPGPTATAEEMGVHPHLHYGQLHMERSDVLLDGMRGEALPLNVICSDGRSRGSVIVGDECSVDELCEQIEKQLGIPEQAQKALVFDGKRMERGQLLTRYTAKPGDNVRLLLNGLWRGMAVRHTPRVMVTFR